MPLYRITLEFSMEGDSALDAFAYASGLEILDDAECQIPPEHVSTRVEFCVEDEVAAVGGPGDLPDNVTPIH